MNSRHTHTHTHTHTTILCPSWIVQDYTGEPAPER